MNRKLSKMILAKFSFRSGAKVLITFFGLLLANHFISCLIFQLCGLSRLTIAGVYCGSFLSVWIYWCRFLRNIRGEKKSERQRLMDELCSIETDKIPYIIDRFLELDRAGKKEGSQDENIAEERRCVVCLDAEASIQTLPCEHKVMCGWCAWQTLKLAFQQGKVHRCVLCRAEVDDFTGSLIKNLVNIKWKDVRKILKELEKI